MSDAVNLFGNVTASENAKENGDFLGYTIGSGVYEMMGDTFYFDKTKGGSLFLRAELTHMDNPERTYTENFYITNKEGSVTTSTNRLMPGAQIVKDMAEIYLGIPMEITDFGDGQRMMEIFKIAQKQVMAYDPEAKEQVPMEKSVATALSGIQMKFAIMKTLEDGYPDPTSTRENNQIDKVLDFATGRTVTEVRANEEVGTWVTSHWKGADTSFVLDRRSESKGNDAKTLRKTSSSGSALSRIKKNRGDDAAPTGMTARERIEQAKKLAKEQSEEAVND